MKTILVVLASFIILSIQVSCLPKKNSNPISHINKSGESGESSESSDAHLIFGLFTDSDQSCWYERQGFNGNTQRLNEQFVTSDEIIAKINGSSSSGEQLSGFSLLADKGSMHKIIRRSHAVTVPFKIVWNCMKISPNIITSCGNAIYKGLDTMRKDLTEMWEEGQEIKKRDEAKKAQSPTNQNTDDETISSNDDTFELKLTSDANASDSDVFEEIDSFTFEELKSDLSSVTPEKSTDPCPSSSTFDK